MDHLVPSKGKSLEVPLVTATYSSVWSFLVFSLLRVDVHGLSAICQACAQIGAVRTFQRLNERDRTDSASKCSLKNAHPTTALPRGLAVCSPLDHSPCLSYHLSAEGFPKPLRKTAFAPQCKVVSVSALRTHVNFSSASTRAFTSLLITNRNQ